MDKIYQCEGLLLDSSHYLSVFYLIVVSSLFISDNLALKALFSSLSFGVMSGVMKIFL